MQGRAAVTVENEDGTTTEIDGAGDPRFFYACIRAPIDVSGGLPDGISMSSLEEGSPVVGVWA